ncbi:hypothetical protein, partial [Aquisphaera insulae]|uniref:hypothetical protein n=1 Tax=Aquisphaera insulae TaxID=2712864 RepID=UPI00196B5534
MLAGVLLERRSQPIELESIPPPDPLPVGVVLEEGPDEVKEVLPGSPAPTGRPGADCLVPAALAADAVPAALMSAELAPDEDGVANR